MSTIKEKKDKILKYITKHMDVLDPSGDNTKRYKKMIDSMSDTQFKEFIQNIRDGKFQLHLIMPNMTHNVEMNNLLKVADDIKLKLFHKLWLTDTTTGQTFLTKHEYPVIQVFIRRQSQFLDEKISLPDDDSVTDLLTGQVTNDDRSSSFTQPEIQALYTKDLTKTLVEVLKIRGGDIKSYGEFKRQLEETGMASLNNIDPNSKTRSVVIAGVLLKGCHLDSNF